MEKEMSLKRVLAKVGITEPRPQWSWGAVRHDGVVFLQVWQHQTRKINGKLAVLVDDGLGSTAGLNERRRHLDMIRNNDRAYALFFKVVDPTEETWRQDRKAEPKRAFLIEDLAVVDGDVFALLGEAKTLELVKG
jgi:hypothetical protein